MGEFGYAIGFAQPDGILADRVTFDAGLFGIA